MRQMAKWRKKSFREWLLNLCGYEIWPPTHNDPTIKGPQPRIISKRQREAMGKCGCGTHRCYDKLFDFDEKPTR